MRSMASRAVADFSAFIHLRKLAADMRHTGHLRYPPRAISVIIPCIGIRMGKARIGFQMFAGMLRPPAGGELIPGSGW